MVHNHRNGKFSKKIIKKMIDEFPRIHLDKMADFASIKLKNGIEAKSYIKDGFIFCEDKSGKIIEIQILNLSKLKRLNKKNINSDVA
ncbi:MAG: hypothetical protein HQK49_07860 [Oligoflexia bacterium]|nr:hypothetical protein [Oligoflexia bacterium]